MMRRCILLLLLLCNIVVRSKEIQSQRKRVCIVGSGIGGSTAAHYLSQMSRDVDLVVFEKESTVGGRISSFEYRGHQIEAGGSIIHISNKYMMDFATELGLTLVKPGSDFDSPPRFGIYDGAQFVFLQSALHEYITIAKMLWRYGPFQLLSMKNIVQNAIQRFTNIYILQDESQSFRHPIELWTALGHQQLKHY
jgi:prenylcysteine oxidase/farnesylcysteine lyase